MLVIGGDMMQLLLLILGQTPATKAPADAVLKRYAAFRKANPNYRLDFVTMGMPPIKGAFQVEGASRIRMTLKSRNSDYVAVITPAGARELEHSSRLYDDHVSFTMLAVPPSRISDDVVAFPRWAFAPSLEAAISSQVKFTLAGKETIDGKVCDKVHSEFALQMGSGKVDASVDALGAIRHIRIETHTMAGDSVSEWKITSWTPQRFTADTFRLPIPDGYVPFSLPVVDGPIPVGGNFPVRGWKSAQGDLDLLGKLGGKGGLIAVMGQGSVPSRRALASLQKLRSEVPVVTLSDGRRADGFDGYDPTGKLIEMLSPPATPLFLLVDGKGKVLSLWMGYSMDRAGAFETAVRNAFREEK